MGRITKNILWIATPAAVAAGAAIAIALDHDPMEEFSASLGNVVILGSIWFLLSAIVFAGIRLAIIKFIRR